MKSTLKPEEEQRLMAWLTDESVPPSMDGLMQRVMVIARHERLRERAAWLTENMDEYLAAHLPSQRPIAWRAPVSLWKENDR